MARPTCDDRDCNMNIEPFVVDGLSPSTAPPTARSIRWPGVLAIIASLVLGGFVFWGFRYHPGYREVIPGDAQPIAARVTIKGAKQFAPRNSLYLVFVRERDNVNYWEYLKAKWVDDDSQLEKIPKGQPAPPAQEGICDMGDSQATAKLVALTRLGYKAAIQPGIVVNSFLLGNAPVSSVLKCGDTIRSIDNVATDTREQLQTQIRRHKGGDTVQVAFDHEGKRVTRAVKLISRDGVALLGIGAQQVRKLPVELSIDTGEIGGPSAGLAMTLTLLDELTPGELTGGRRVVATGTISPDGTVGEIGSVDLKAIAARQRKADLFLIPMCQADPVKDPIDLKACQRSNAQAKINAKGVEVVEVRTLDEALAVLARHGGSPLPASSSLAKA